MEKAAESGDAGPGARLVAARERAGLTLIQAAERLHLDASTLQALESGRFEALGAAVFVRGHLRRYAELLGVPTAEIEAAYAACSARMAPLPDLRRVATPLEGTNSRGVTLAPHSALVGTIIVVLLALVWWAMRLPSTVRRPPASTAAPSPGAAPPAAASQEGAAPAPSPTLVAAAGASAPADPPTAATGQVRLGLKFNQDSWAEIYDANGSRLLYDLGSAGSVRRLAGQPPLRILLGNPEGVSLELDGRAVPLGGAADSSAPLRFSLDGGGRIIEVRAPQGAASAPSLQP